MKLHKHPANCFLRMLKKRVASLLPAVLLSTLFTFTIVYSAPGDVLYQNNFDSESELDNDWSREGGNNNNDFQTDTTTSNSGGRSLRIRDGSGGVTNSGLIDASGVTELEVSIWVQSGNSNGTDPDSGEDLELYYSDSSGSFNLLFTFDGSASANTVFEEVIALPADALHSDLRFRLDMTSGANNDRWYVDDFIVREPADGGGGGGGGGDSGGGSGTACLDVFPGATQSPGPTLTIPTFETSSSNSDTSGGNLSLAAGDYKDVNVDQNGSLTFTTTDGTYKLNKLQTNKNATVTFAPGDYFIDQLQFDQGTTVSLSGSGTVRIYTNDLSMDKNVNLASGDTYLIIVAYSSDISIDQGLDFDGVLYTEGDVSIGKNSTVNGSITGGSFSFESNVTVNYDDSYVTNADFNGMCDGGTTPSSLEYIEITTDGSALTCTSEEITLRACANSDCSTVATEDVIVTLGVTGNATWSTNPVTIPANSSSGVTVTLTDRTAETVTVSVSSTSVATTGTSPQCSNGTCQVSFTDSGFLLSLPNHSSCAGSTLSIQAVQLSDTGNSCAPVYTGSQSVGFSFSYSNPATGSTTPVLDSTAMAAAGNTQIRTINFDSTASASLPFSYDDAGQLSVTVSDQGSNGLTSATVNTIVTPAKLLVFTNDANNACAGADYGSCTAFKTAGIPGDASSEFNLTVSGACADDTVTSNFELSSIALSPNLVAPSAGTNGSLGVTSVDITSGGTATVSQTISEVGAFTITATPGSYLGQSIPAATSSTIGRFTPDRFLIADNSPMLDDATCDFTYQGQDTGFAPGLAPEITVTAVNSNGATTVNYGGDGVANNDFWNLNSADYSGRTYTNQATPYPGSITATLNAVTIAGETDYDGIHTISFDNDSITHNKAGVTPQTTNDAPFDAEVLLTLTSASLTDTDSIFYDSDTNGVADDYQATTIDGTNIRWGRWSLENGFGSELQAISMNLTAQYFDGTQFVTATTDNCTSSVTLNLSNYTDNLSAGETTASQTAITSGIIPISLSAPGAGNTGSVLITVTTPSWLTYDYDGDAVAEDVQATATFGIYEGRRPIIIRRQTY